MVWGFGVPSKTAQRPEQFSFFSNTSRRVRACDPDPAWAPLQVGGDCDAAQALEPASESNHLASSHGLGKFSLD
jgi:hypothetical protein